jgi:hypothetical protein
MDVQDQNEAYTNFTLATQDHVDMRFNSAEMALQLDDFSARYIEPAVKVLVSAIEGDFIAYATKAVWNTVGTAGTPPVDLAAPGAARAKLNQNLAPKDGNRYVQMDSVTMGGLVNGLKGLFQDSAQIREQYREGMIGRTGMADWYENDRMWAMTNGADVTSNTTDGASLVTDGGTTMDMHSTVATSAMNVGQVFTVAGIYACHPETKQSLGYLQQFVVTALDSPAANQITVAPAIYLGLSGSTAAKQNVCKSTSAKLALTDFNSQVVTFIGAASTSYTQNLMYHKEAFQFVTADLPIMDDAARCVRRSQDGLSLRVWQASDIRNDEQLMRIDILYGFAALRPEWACRITN